MNTQEIRLDLDKRVTVAERVIIGQGDKGGTTIVAHIFDHSVAYDLSDKSARFEMRLPRQSEYLRDTNCTTSGNTITYVVDEDHAAAVYGTTDCAYFDILAGDDVIASTARFSIEVLRSAHDGATPAQSWDNAIEQLVRRGEQAVSDAEDAVSDAQDAITDANAAVSNANAATASANSAATNANDKAALANTAAANANTKAGEANTAAGNANTAASNATSAASNANAAAENANEKADLAQQVLDDGIPLMSPDTRGGAKLEQHGGLALRDGALGIGSLVQESDGYARGGLAQVTAKGHAEQDGTPTPDNPVPIQVVRGRNLLDLSGDEVGEINASGIIGVATTFRHTKLIEVETSATYTLSVGSGDDSQINRLHGYDSGGVWQESIGYVGNGTNGNIKTITVTIPAGVKYIRLSYYVNVSFVQLELGSTPTPYVPYGHVGMESQGRNLVFGMVNKYFSVNSSNVLTITAGANMRSALARVEPNKTYTFSRVGGNRTMIAIVNSDNPTTVVRQIVNNQTLTTHTFATQSDERFVMMYVTNDVNASPVTSVQLELGSVAHDYEPYYHTTTPIPLPSRGWVGSLPDGTADALRLDGAGKCEWECVSGEYTLTGNEGNSNFDASIGLIVVEIPDIKKRTSTEDSLFMCDKLISRYSNNSNSAYRLLSDGKANFVYSGFTSAAIAMSMLTGATVLYPLATPITEDCGYVDMPEISGECQVSIPELDALGIKYFVDDSVTQYGREIYARVRSEYADRITALEQVVAELATS